jgi:creatinine amidohydrolase
MRKLLFLLALSTTQAFGQKTNSDNKAIFLEDISWTKAREILTPEKVIVIPLGAAAKEHGPHLPLSTDFIQAEGFTNILAKERKVVIAPIINYSFYSLFLKYAGSTSLDFTTSTNMVLNIVRSLAGYGPKRFYVINIGSSTTPALSTAAKILADEGILLYYSDFDRPNFITVKPANSKDYDTHAGELETSKVLFFRPDLVDMNKAVNENTSRENRGLILSPEKVDNNTFNASAIQYNASGILGDAVLGTQEKGKLYVQALATEMIKEIDSITVCSLPIVKNRAGEFKKYEGEYSRPGGNNFIIKQVDNNLWVKLVDQSYYIPHALFHNVDGYFVGQFLTILFVEDENGQVVKAWCQAVRGSYWATKVK